MNTASAAITHDDAKLPYDGDMIIVASRQNALDGELLRGRLLADGIPATLGDNYLVNANALWTPAIGGVRIRVPASFKDRALRIIEDLESGALTLPDDDDTAESLAQATAFAASRRRSLRLCLAAFVGIGLISELLNALAS